MGDFSRSNFWECREETYSSDEDNSGQIRMERAMRAYDSGPRSPHTPLSPTPDDDPIFYRSPPGPPFFPLQSFPLQYHFAFNEVEVKTGLWKVLGYTTVNCTVFTFFVGQAVTKCPSK